jgi:hypothetical protein
MREKQGGGFFEEKWRRGEVQGSRFKVQGWKNGGSRWKREIPWGNFVSLSTLTLFSPFFPVQSFLASVLFYRREQR